MLQCPEQWEFGKSGFGDYSAFFILIKCPLWSWKKVTHTVILHHCHTTRCDPTPVIVKVKTFIILCGSRLGSLMRSFGARLSICSYLCVRASVKLHHSSRTPGMELCLRKAYFSLILITKGGRLRH